MESELLGIGEMARASGLTVSALRFYDSAGVLEPALVDPATGYRRYTRDQVAPARLVAGLRRVAMPLAEIARVLRHRREPAIAGRLLDAHLRRLEDGLADAHRELSRLKSLLDSEENTMTGTSTRATLPTADLVGAFDAVRFAVGDNPEFPVLSGVLIEVRDGALCLVATDRYRLAVAEVPVGDVAGPPVSVVVPATLLDEARVLLAGGEEAAIVVDGPAIVVEVGARQVRGTALDLDFPDYRRLLGEPGGQRCRVDVPAFQRALATGPTHLASDQGGGALGETIILTVDDIGAIAVGDPAAPADDVLRIGVNREFLLEAVSAAGREELVLALDGPIRPLALRTPEDDRTLSILMPVRLP